MDKYIECKKILDFCNVVINRQGNEEEMNVVVESFKAFAEYVKALPPEDVQPVVHGEWRDTGSGQECCVCGEIQYGYDSGRYYCANCGAKMDGKGANNG